MGKCTKRCPMSACTRPQTRSVPSPKQLAGMSADVLRSSLFLFFAFCSASSFAYTSIPLSTTSRLQHKARGAPFRSAPQFRLFSAASVLRMDVDQPRRSNEKEQLAPPDPLQRPPSTRLTEHSICVIGLSHKTAPVEVRERLSAKEDEWNALARQLCELANVQEAAVLSTCNRFELYIITDDNRKAVREVTELLSERSGVSLRELREHLFMLDDYEGVWHVMRVAAGLDSLVVGEGQILSQVKRCYEVSTDRGGSAGKVLSRMLNAAVAAGKRVRTETAIARGGVSVSSAAVELAEARAEDTTGLPLKECSVSIIGAGKMGRLLVQHLLPRGVGAITVVNRSEQKAQELAAAFPEATIEVAGMGEMLSRAIGGSHVVFTCTGATEPIIDRERVEGVLGRRTMLVDISVPRNIHQDTALHPLASVFNVDDLEAVVAANQARRRRVADQAEDLLVEELQAFETWQNSLCTVPMISRLQNRAERIRQQEIIKALRRLNGLTPKEREVVERLSKGIVNKLLHGPLLHLRTVDTVEERTRTVQSVADMFQLSDDADPTTSSE